MATPATLSDQHELHARLHDLSVVAARTRGRQRALRAAMPAPSVWSGQSAEAYTRERLVVRVAALGTLASALDAVAGQLDGVVRALPEPVTVGVDAGSPAAAVRSAQRLLAAAGGAPGAVDGVWGAASVAAVGRIQARAGLPVTGHVDAATALAISAAAVGGAVAVGGAPGVPRGLLPLSSMPAVAPAPGSGDPAPTGTSTGGASAGPTASDAGSADGGGADGTDAGPGDAGADPDPSGEGSDPAGSDSGSGSSGDGSSGDGSTDSGTSEGDDPLPSGGTADGGTDAVSPNLLRELSPAPSTSAPSLP